MYWHCEVFNLLSVRSWEGEVFLYNPLTTHTHILNELGWRVLEACAGAPLSLERLLETLAEDNPDHNHAEELSAVISSHLDQLAQLGLLEGSRQRAAL
jgi:PqqD family protein of HPr-rel-A system